jgi:hypothetical protein
MAHSDTVLRNRKLPKAGVCASRAFGFHGLFHQRRYKSGKLDMINLDWATAGRVLPEKNPRHKKRVVATRSAKLREPRNS